MTAHVARVYRTVSGRHTEWWWFFSQPLVYSVWFKPDGVKTMDRFFEEQLAKARAHKAAQ